MKKGLLAARKLDFLVSGIGIESYRSKRASNKCDSEWREEFKATFNKDKRATPNKPCKEIRSKPGTGLLHPERLLLRGGIALKLSSRLLFDR